MFSDFLPLRLLSREVGNLPGRRRSSLDAQCGLHCAARVQYQGLHHVGLLVEDLGRSLQFYEGVLGLEVNPARPNDKLPYRGAWLWIGRCRLSAQLCP